jgi:hypothetical protein
MKTEMQTTIVSAPGGERAGRACVGVGGQPRPWGEALLETSRSNGGRGEPDDQHVTQRRDRGSDEALAIDERRDRCQERQRREAVPPDPEVVGHGRERTPSDPDGRDDGWQGGGDEHQDDEQASLSRMHQVVGPERRAVSDEQQVDAKAEARRNRAEP